MMEPEKKTRPPQPDRWNLTAEEITELLRRTGVEPRRGSPFAHLRGGMKGSPEELVIGDTPEIREAVAHIGRPDLIIGLLHVPPADPDVSWFYGTSGDRRFAVHRRDGGLWHRIVWPVQDTTLAVIMETVVSSHEPAVTDGCALRLDRNGFETLAVIVDFIQEETLRSAMNRTGLSVPRFDIDDLFACHQRNLRGIDLRWMVQRAKLIAPVRLAPDHDGLRSGLDALAGQGMLVPEGTLYRTTPRFAEACTLLAGCSGFFALSTRRRMARSDGNDEWDFQHMAALRGIGSLWLLEFSDISPGGFTVKLGDVTVGLLHERIAAGLRPPERPPVPDDGTATRKRCEACGSMLQPPAKFCPGCGERIAEKTESGAAPVFTPEPPPAEPPPLAAPETDGIRCPKCGAAMASGKRFCTKCGTALLNPPPSGGNQP